MGAFTKCDRSRKHSECDMPCIQSNMSISNCVTWLKQILDPSHFFQNANSFLSFPELSSIFSSSSTCILLTPPVTYLLVDGITGIVGSQHHKIGTEHNINRTRDPCLSPIRLSCHTVLINLTEQTKKSERKHTPFSQHSHNITLPFSVIVFPNRLRVGSAGR